ncbi:hypothetical protein RGCCGE502_16325 [Rhizobium grahamii CCGE 502]|uniref:Uncharacterized protein n=1 Tax=Rhizobium grahamii CCGE 502 TaxID=990285 RepID=S3HVH9_9HYPH|nr:hypothetical protein RGCCGE502_16325 [Rhizobium grahamii CCGE 502]
MDSEIGAASAKTTAKLHGKKNARRDRRHQCGEVVLDWPHGSGNSRTANRCRQTCEQADRLSLDF